MGRGSVLVREVLGDLSINTAALTKATQTFITNAKNAADLAEVPFEFVRYGMKLERALAVANFVERGTFTGGVPGRLLGGVPDANLFTKLLRDEIDTPHRNYVQSSGVVTADVIEVMNESARKMLTSLMNSQVILMWSAFEALAGDLWNAAVNHHPETLAELTGVNAQDLLDENGNATAKTVPLSFIIKHKFKIHDKMGTVHTENRIKFDKLREIILAYRAAFPELCKLNSVDFWKDRHLKAICAIRNNLVHKAGKVDKQFTKQRGDEISIAHYQVDDDIVLEGTMMQSILGGFVKFCVLMVQEVDGWLRANPVTPAPP